MPQVIEESPQIKVNFNCVSLEFIIKVFLEVSLDKTHQVSDWRIRPLPKAMLNYARLDSHYLILIYALMQTMLDDS